MKLGVRREQMDLPGECHSLRAEMCPGCGCHSRHPCSCYSESWLERPLLLAASDLLKKRWRKTHNVTPRETKDLRLNLS